MKNCCGNNNGKLIEIRNKINNNFIFGAHTIADSWYSINNNSSMV